MTPLEERRKRLLGQLSTEERRRQLLHVDSRLRMPDDVSLGQSVYRQFMQAPFLQPAISGLKWTGGVSKKVGDVYLPESMEQPVEETFGYKAGTALESFFERHAPVRHKGQWPVKVASAAGYMAGVASTGAVGATTKLGMTGAKLFSMLHGAFSQAGASYDDALQKTGDPDTSFISGLHGWASGSSEAVVSKAIGRIMSIGIPKGIASKVGQRLIDKGIKGVGQAISKGTAKGLIGGTEEAIQEGLQAYYEGMSAKQLYDESRNIQRDILESAVIGFGIGFVLNAFGVAIALNLHQPGVPVDDQQLLQDAQATVEDAKIKVADELAQTFPDTTPEYWQRQMTQPEAVEISDREATTLARTKVIDDIRNDTHTWITDKQNIQQATKATIEAIEQTGGAQLVQQQEYDTQVADATAEYQKEVDVGTYKPTTQITQTDIDKLKRDTEQEPRISELEQEIATLEQLDTAEMPALQSWATGDWLPSSIRDLWNVGIQRNYITADNANVVERLTKAIQELDKSSVIEVEHLSEAIQYISPKLPTDVEYQQRMQEVFDKAGLNQKQVASVVTPDEQVVLLDEVIAAEAFPVPAVTEVAKEPWETSDLATHPNTPIGYIEAKKQADGKWKLFARGTRNEIFPGETFNSASEARNFFKVQQIKAQQSVTKLEEEVTPQVNQEVITAINKELSTIEDFEGLSEADIANPEKVEQARQWALIRIYKKLGRIPEAKDVAGLKNYKRFSRGVKTEIKSRLLLSETDVLRRRIQVDIAKKVAKEIPKPKPSEGLSKTEQKQVAKELQAGVNATLATMGRVPDGSIRAKPVSMPDGRFAKIKGNKILFITKHAKGKETYTTLELTDEQMDDAVAIFTGIETVPMERGPRGKLIDRLMSLYSLTHGLKLGDMKAVMNVADIKDTDFNYENFRQGLGSMLAAGGTEGNQNFVRLAMIIDSTNDLNKISKAVGKVAKTRKPGQPPGEEIGTIADQNLISQLTVLRKKAGQPGVNFVNLLSEEIQEEAILEHGYKVRFRNGVYNVLRELHGRRNQRIRNSMARIERYLDGMQDKGRSNIRLNQDEEVAASNLRALYNDIWDDSLSAGVITPEQHRDLYVEYYLPKQWDFDAIVSENRTHEVITDIMQKKGIPHSEAHDLWNRFIRSKRDRTNYSLEEERQVKGLDSGIKGLEVRTYRYIEEAARRIKQVEKFGKQDTKLDAFITTMEANHPTHASFARNVKRNALALDVKDASAKVESKQIAHLRSAVALTSLSWSWVQNLTEPALLTFRFSLWDTIKASKKFVVDAKLSTELAEDAAAIPITNAKSTIGKIFSKSMDDYITQQMQYDEGKFGKVREFGFRLYGFTPTERFGKILAANTAVEYADSMLRRLAKNPNNSWARKRLVELVNTVDGNEADALIQAAGKDKKVTLEKLAKSSSQQIAQLAQDAINQAGVRGIDDVGIGPTGMLRRPLSWSKDPRGRLITQFRSWTFQVTRMMKEELRKGGARAWLKLAGVFLPVSIVTSLAERLAGRLLFGKDLPEDDAEWLWAAIEAPFALGLAGIYYRALYTSVTRPWAWAELIAPPAIARPFRVGVRVVEDISGLIKGKPTFKTGEELLGLVPVIGRPATGYMRRAKRKKKKGKVTF